MWSSAASATGRTALDEETRTLHDLRVEASRPRDHERMGSHGVPDAECRISELIGKFFAGGDAGKSRREVTQRKGEGGDAAVVAGQEYLILL